MYDRATQEYKKSLGFTLTDWPVMFAFSLSTRRLWHPGSRTSSTSKSTTRSSIKRPFAEAFYNTTPGYVQQPLLEAYAEKAKEQVFLLPEYCNVTGITEAVRKEKTSMAEALKSLKAAPQERLAAIVSHTEEQPQGHTHEVYRLDAMI